MSVRGGNQWILGLLSNLVFIHRANQFYRYIQFRGFSFTKFGIKALWRLQLLKYMRTLNLKFQKARTKIEVVLSQFSDPSEILNVRSSNTPETVAFTIPWYLEVYKTPESPSVDAYFASWMGCQNWFHLCTCNFFLLISVCLGGVLHLYWEMLVGFHFQ